MSADRRPLRLPVYDLTVAALGDPAAAIDVINKIARDHGYPLPPPRPDVTAPIPRVQVTQGRPARGGR